MYPIKVKEVTNNKDKSLTYTLENYYSTFYSYKSVEKSNNNNNKDLIEILKEIKRRKDVVVLIKEEREKIKSIKSNKNRLLIKIENMRKQVEYNYSIIKSI